MTTRTTTAGTAKNVSRHGIAAVECAITAPLLTLLVLGAVDVGQYANVYQKVSDASRAGARVGVKYDTTTQSQIEAAVVSYLQEAFPNVPPATLASATQVGVTDFWGTPISGGDLTTINSGRSIKVTVTVEFDLIRWISRLPFLDGSDVRIMTRMRRE